MSEIEARSQGRIYAIEFLLTQALAERFRCDSDEGRITDGHRMLQEIAACVADLPPPIQTGAIETADRILKKALMDSARLG